MRLINNTIRWARKANATTATYHMVADQTDAGRGPRAACNRSWALDLTAGGPGYTGRTADQVAQSTYGMFCDKCRTKAEALTSGDQMARDRDHAEALAIVAADLAARTSAEAPVTVHYQTGRGLFVCETSDRPARVWTLDGRPATCAHCLAIETPSGTVV